MPANTTPIYTLTPNINGANVTAANTKSDGSGTIGTDIYKCFTAGANGSFVSKVRFSPTATVASTATAATCFRIYISTKTSGATTPGTDTWQIAEISAAAQTADAPTANTYPIEIPINVAIPASYTVLVSNHVVANASTAWVAVVFGGDY